MKAASHRLLVGSVVILLTALLPSAAAAQVRFPVPGGGNPAGITVGPDGALWFTQNTSNQVGRITVDGQFQEFSIPSGSLPDDIIAGPDGRLWFTEPGRSKIGAITTAGAVTEYPSGSGTLAAPPDGLTGGPDGRIWFTASNSDGSVSRVGRMGTDGSGISQFSLASGASPSDITAGPDGRLWFTESGTDQLGTITTSGGLGEKYPTGLEPGAITAGPGASLWFTETGADQIGRLVNGVIGHFGPTSAGPSGITIGPDDALWFSQFDDPLTGGTGASSIGRVNFQGAITNVPLPVGSHPDGITAGPAGRREIWFTENGHNNIARIDLPPPFVPPPPTPAATPKPTAKPKPKACKVPKLRGLPVKKAKKRLKRAKCRYRIRGKGRVVSTSPRAGRRTTKIVKVKASRKARKAGKSTASAGAIR